MTYASGICEHCGEKKEHHHTIEVEDGIYAHVCDGMNSTAFLDSGVERVRDNAEGVLRAAQEFKDYVHSNAELRMNLMDGYFVRFNALESAISKSIGGEGEATTGVKEQRANERE